MLLLIECITRSSSLSMEEIKLFAIVNWIFHVSKFLRLLMMSFKHDLILLRYSSTDSFFSYWFIIIFFLMLKKIFNISKYSIFNYFSFFFSSKTISQILNCSVIYFFFFKKKKKKKSGNIVVNVTKIYQKLKKKSFLIKE